MAASPPTPDSAQQAAEMAALSRMLDLSRGSFSLSISICNSPALRDYLIGEIKSAKPQLTVVSIPRETVDVFGFVDGQCADAAPEALFVVDLEGSIDSSQQDQPALRSLNASRELWERRFECPVVFWLPEYAATLMSTEARDFWRYRSHRFEFVSEQATALAGTHDRFAGDLSVAGNLPVDEKQFRIAELEQRVADAGPAPIEGLLRHVLVWLNELGFLYDFVGDLDKAEQSVRKSLEINEKVGSKVGMARDYGNLGLIFCDRGDFDRALELQREALTINTELGRQKQAANNYRHLGIVYRIRGDLEKAEKLVRKALVIHEQVGLRQEIAKDYGNLGNIMHCRGEWRQAEEMHLKALALNKELGHEVAMAGDYGNLAAVYDGFEEFDRAEEMIRNALAIEEQLGYLAGVARQYSNLAAICIKRGDLESAESLSRKSLHLNEKLGSRMGIAISCANLGHIAAERGDHSEARAMTIRALELFKQAGMPTEVDSVQGLLDGLAD